MKILTPVITIIYLITITACAADTHSSEPNNTVQWQAGSDIEQFWHSYTASKGGLTWGQSADYPPFNQVNEGDTFMVESEQGLCLMEFFHNRWRRANDFRRWDDSINDYGGCPYVFE